MAGKVSAKGAVIAVDDAAGTARTISADVESYEIEYAVEPQEVTGFGEGSKNYIPGQRVIGITLNVFWNTTASTGATTVINGIIAATTSKTVTITPEDSATALSGEFMCDGVTVGGEAAGSPIKLGAVHFSVMGATAPTWS